MENRPLVINEDILMNLKEALEIVKEQECEE